MITRYNMFPLDNMLSLTVTNKASSTVHC